MKSRGGQQGLILIVEDNPQNIQVLGNIIRDAGYDVAVAMNGNEALEYLAGDVADLILLDVMMPEIDGFEVLKQLKAVKHTREVPVIFLTALKELEDKLKAFSWGAVDYITKPFVKEEVLARIHVHVSLKKALQKLKQVAVTDELTGCYNRRFCYEILDRQINRTRRTKGKFVICYIDINNLKKINDTYGHLEGDQLIKKVAQALKTGIRNTDYLFRMGGDEFLILFPDTEKEKSTGLIGRIKGGLNKQNIKKIPIDFSFGSVQFCYEDTIGIDELIGKADLAMYRNKTDNRKTMANRNEK